MSAAGADDGALVTLTGYYPNANNHAWSSDRLDRFSNTFELRAGLRPHAVDARIAACGSRVYTDPSIVTEELEDGTRMSRWTGIVLCNRAGCPVCGAVKARRFHDQTLRALQGGGFWQHVVLTVPHSRADDWQDVYSRLLAAVHELSKGQCGRLVMPLVRATIRATESTWGYRNGWHVHLHCLWQMARPLLPEEERIAREQWAARTGASEEKGVTFGMVYHCETEASRRRAAHYLTKIAAEMAGVGKSAHPEHWNLGELYRRAADGHEQSLRLVQEYQQQSKGKRLYQFDRRAQRLHDTSPELPELAVVARWVTPIDRLEFRQLSRGERFHGDRLACYLPLEVAARCRGDPTDAVLDTIYDLAGGFERINC